MLACWLHATDDLRGAQMVSSKQFCGAVLVLAAAVLVAAKVDNIIHEVRFAEVYRHWSASETEKSIYVNAGDMILVRMNENPGTGYRWQLVTDDKDGFDQTLCQLQATSGPKHSPSAVVLVQGDPSVRVGVIANQLCSLGQAPAAAFGNGRFAVKQQSPQA